MVSRRGDRVPSSASGGPESMGSADASTSARTSGSAAGGTGTSARADSRASGTGRPPGKRYTQRFSGFALILLATIIIGVLALAPGLRTLVEQRQQISDLQAKVSEQKANVQSLSEQVDRWKDPAYIRAQTRQRLFFVVPGEKSFVILDDTGASDSSSGSDDSAPTTAITTTDYDWRQLVGSSWYEAATSTSARNDSGE